MKKIKIVELFSGIGSQAQALKNLGYDVDVAATCEWDIHAFIGYDTIHNGSELDGSVVDMSREQLLEVLSEYSLSNNGKAPLPKRTLAQYSTAFLKRILSAIRKTNNLVDVSKVTANQVPNSVDLMTYSFPCQDLSNVGAFHGYTKGIDKDSGSRSSLLWQVGRILSEMKAENRRLPRMLLMENVPTLLSDRHKKNFDMWIQELEDLGYMSKYFLLTASDFGTPQSRQRLLMLSVFVGTNAQRAAQVRIFFESTSVESVVADYKASEFFQQRRVRDLLRIPQRQGGDLWQEAVACTPNNTESRKRIWDDNPKLLDEFGNFCPKDKPIRTLTTKQDRHPNSGNVYFDSGIPGRAKFRYLTPRECLLFMGFTDKDYKALVKGNIDVKENRELFTRDKTIRLAGNSIPVKLLEGLFYQFSRILTMN